MLILHSPTCVLRIMFNDKDSNNQVRYDDFVLALYCDVAPMLQL